MRILKILSVSLRITTFLLFCDYSEGQNWEWASQLVGWQEDRCLSFTMDLSKNSYMTGDFQTSLSSCYSNHPNSNGFIAKFDSNGINQWCTWFGGTLITTPKSIAYDTSGFLYLTGNFMDTTVFGADTLIAEAIDIFVSKVDTNGNFIWTRRAGGNNLDYGNSVCVLSDGILVTGTFRNTASFGLNQVVSAGSNDLFIAKYDWNGNCLWVSRGGGSGDDSGTCFDFGYGNRALVGGEFNSTADFGLQTLTTQGATDVVILEIDSLGVMQVLTNYGSTGSDHINDIRSDSIGNIYTTGSFENICYVNGDSMISAGMEDLYCLKFDVSGNLIYKFGGGGPYNENGRSLAVNAQMEIYATGYFSGTSVFDTVTIIPNGIDIYLLKLDSNGLFKWITGTPAPLSTIVIPAKIEVDELDNIYVAGTFRYYAYFGNFTLGAGLKTNPFIFKYNPTLTTGTNNIVNENYAIEIFPTPFSNNVFVETKIPWEMEFILYDTTGRIVIRKSIAGSSTIDGSLLPEGIYFYEFRHKTGKLKQGKILKVSTL